MATREENLKKINEELEKFSDDELEKVAGGALIFKIDGKSENDKTQNENPAPRFGVRV